ncbi:hypothetical protein L218DRAFT_509088 [Marasmius fiardii PR-910]|nr:hypothetical protein L218DRAFT_509088 [Marasmius fiardii PR-910]
MPEQLPNLETNFKSLTPTSKSGRFSHTIAVHLADTYFPSISQYHVPNKTTRCKRFIQFARSRSRNKEYLDALKTIEKLLSLTMVALGNFNRPLNQYNNPDATYPYSSPFLTAEETISDSSDTNYACDDVESSSTMSDSWPPTPNPTLDTSTTSVSKVELSILATTYSENWEWLAELVILLWETVHTGKCDVITNPQRNSWSRWMEARYHDWLTGDVPSLALDHRDNIDQELCDSGFDFTEFVEELLIPGRRYGLLLEVLSQHRSLVLPLKMDRDEDDGRVRD